jgi:hypothetical protein
MEVDKIIQALAPAEGSYLQQLLSSPTERLTLHSDIELTEEELIDAIIKAKVDKAANIEAQQKEEVRKKKSADLVKIWNKDELIAFCQEFYYQRFDGLQFVIDDNNRDLVYKLALYFTNDPEFEKMGYSLRKGNLIMGNVGTGKTELMKFFQKNKKQCFSVKSCIDVAGDFSIYKNDIDAIYSTGIEKPLHDPTVFFQKEIGYCFDDLGTEQVKNDYGNKKDVMVDIIMAIYNKKNFPLFQMTTNLSSKQEIEERYGTRFNSRLREIFNVFVLKGNDRRK